MSNKSRTALFIALIVTALVLLGLKGRDIFDKFAKQETPLQRPLPIDTETVLSQKQLEQKSIELRALSDEIDEKLEDLRQVEANILKLIKQKEELVAGLPTKAEEILDADNKLESIIKDANEEKDDDDFADIDTDDTILIEVTDE